MEAMAAKAATPASIAIVTNDSENDAPVTLDSFRMDLMLKRICVLAAFVVSLVASPLVADELRVYIGTYTKKDASKGIYLSKLDTATGKISAPELAGETTNPSFLALSPNGKNLFAIGEVGTFNGKKSGMVSSFTVDPATGKLTAVNQQPSGGVGPCFVAVDKEGTNVLVANYGSGSVAALPVGAGGKLEAPSAEIQHAGEVADPKRQGGPHAHSINLDKAGKYAFACDLGLDKVFVYKFDPAAGKLTANDPPAAVLAPRSGPRHFAWTPDGKAAFVINEIGNTITSFAYNAEKGILTTIETVPTLPSEVKGNSTADIVVHPSGKFVYGSNRGHDSIVAYAIEPTQDAAKPIKLRLIGHTPTGGKTPRNFNIDPSGAWLLAANQSSNTITVFKIDANTGGLTAVGEPLAIPAPVCIKFVKP
jgi:6-phosphogluconolactonase